MFKKLNKNIKGFTLMELIIVMAVIGILVMLAAPKFKEFQEKAHLTQIRNDIKVVENQVLSDMKFNSISKEFDGFKLKDGEFNKIINNKKHKFVYSKEGFVDKVLDKELNSQFYLIPDTVKEKVDTKLKGDFIISNDTELVYYIDNFKIKSSNQKAQHDLVYNHFPKMGFAIYNTKRFLADFNQLLDGTTPVRVGNTSITHKYGYISYFDKDSNIIPGGLSNVEFLQDKYIVINGECNNITCGNKKPLTVVKTDESKESTVFNTIIPLKDVSYIQLAYSNGFTTDTATISSLTILNSNDLNDVWEKRLDVPNELELLN